MESTTDRIVKEVELAAPIARVWAAVTNSQEFGEWFGATFDGPFVLGEWIRGTTIGPSCVGAPMMMRIEAMEPEARFAYRWHPGASSVDAADVDTEPTTLVEFLLTPIEAGTRLVITESGFDALPAGKRDEAYRSNDGGWAYQVKQIEAHIAKPAGTDAAQ